MKSFAKNGFKVSMFHKALAFANWLQNIPNKVTPPPFRLLQIGSSFWQSRALYVATSLGIADVVADVEKSVDSIASEVNVNADHLYRLMRMLSSLGIFKEGDEKKFSNSKLSECLREKHPQSVRSMILMHNSPEMTLPWMEALEESIRDGGVPFVKVHNSNLFDYMDEHKEFDSLFGKAMDSVEAITGTDFLLDLDWRMFTRLIDIGGSKGAKSIKILQNYPNLNIEVYDRVQTIEEARQHWNGKLDETLLEKIKFTGGDFFFSVPDSISNDDVYFFSAIFHGFSDEECLVILSNVKKASGKYKPFIVIGDVVLNESNCDSMQASMDMQMLIGTNGRERTMSDWERLIDQAGYELREVVATRSFAKYLLIQ